MTQPKLPKGIYQRGGVYWITYTVGGKRLRESTKSEDLKLAKALLSKRKTEIFENRFTPTKKKTDLTVEGLQTMWFERDRTKVKKSLSDDKQRFQGMVDLLGKATLVSSLTLKSIEKLQSQLKARTVGPKKKRPISATTVNRYLEILTAALKYAADHGYAHQDPMKGIEFAKERHKDRICTPEEYRALMGLTKRVDPEFKLAITVGYYSGMRLGEITGLTWSRVDLNKGFMHLREIDTKTGNPVAVPISDELLPVLKAWKKQQKVVALEGKLFKRSSSSISKTCAKYCRRLGFEGLTFHSFRHTLITRLLENDVDAIIVASISGHKTLETVRRYATISDEKKKKVMAKLSQSS